MLTREKIVVIILGISAMFFIAIGTIGIIFFYYNGDEILGKAILALGSLSFGLFLLNNKPYIEIIYKSFTLAKIFTYGLLFCSGILLYSLESDSLSKNNVLFTIPLYVASLTIGLFFASNFIGKYLSVKNPK